MPPSSDPNKSSNRNFVFNITSLIALFLGLETIYTYHDRLPQYSKVIRIHTGLMVALFVLLCVYALLSILQFTRISEVTRLIAKLAVVIGALSVLSAPMFIDTFNEGVAQGDIFDFSRSSSDLYQVYFPNGRAEAYETELAQLKQALSRYDGCKLLQIDVYGYASSAPFSTDNENKNLQLANERAENIVSDLANWGLNAKPRCWLKSEEMRAKRGHVDQDDVGNRVREREGLNRRVDLVLTNKEYCIVNK